MRLGILVSHPVQYYAPLFRELSKRLDVHVFYGQLSDAQQQAAAGFGVKFDWDVDLMSGYPSTVLTSVAAAPNVNTFSGCDVPNISDVFREREIDAVLVFGWYQKVFLQAVWAAKKARLPVMVRGDSHLGTPAGALTQTIKNTTYPILLRAFDAAIYVGQLSKQYYKHFRYPESRLFFSPHCIDTEWFSARATPDARAERRAAMGVNDNRPLILFAGKLIELKRPFDLLHAVAKLRNADSRAEMVIAGSGPLLPALEAKAAELGVPLHSLGFCNQTEMPAVYAAADVLALVSRYETWGLVCNEALACGTPIVVSDNVGCAPDLAADDNVGRQYTGGNVSAMAEVIGRTLKDPPDKYEIAGLSARYSLARSADGIESAMRYVCDAY